MFKCEAARVSRRSFLKKLMLAAAGVLGTSTLAAYLLHATPTTEVRVRPKPISFLKLPEPSTLGGVSVEEALLRRRSRRSYVKKPLSLKQVSQLLWSAQGITLREKGFRTAPSAGATYPLELYVAVKSGGVVELEPGVYRYVPWEHGVECLIPRDVSLELMSAALDQEWVGEAPVNLVITAVFERTTRRYGERGRRYVWLEAGHAAENIYLQAESLGLGMVVVGAFYDDEVSRILSLPFGEEPVYIIPVGVPRVG